MMFLKTAIGVGSASAMLIGVPVHGKALESVSALEQQLAQFLGKEKGEVGGPRGGIDPRLRLKKCQEPIVFDMRGKDLLIIRCISQNWRIPVPLIRSETDRRNTSRKPLIVKRGEPVLLVIEKNGFLISRQMQADRNGGVGDIIPVRAARRSSPILAEITGEGRVSLPSQSNR